MDYFIHLIQNMSYWNWLVIGVVLLGIEMLTSTIVLLWFAIGSILVGILMLFTGEISWQHQLIAYSLFTLSSVFLIRFFKHLFKLRPTDDTVLNDRSAQLVHRLAVMKSSSGLEGSVEIDGVVWRVRMLEKIKKGQPVQIVSSDDGVLTVIPCKEKI